LREEVETHRAALDGEEHAALAAIRARAQALADALDEQRRTLGAAEREGLAALEQRLATLRSASTTLGSAVADQENAALASWQARSEAQVRALRTALDTLTAAQDHAQADAEARLAAFAAASHQLAQTLASDGAAFDAQLAERRAALVGWRRRPARDARTPHGRDRPRDCRTPRRREQRRQRSDRGARHPLADLDRALDTQRTRQQDEARRLTAQCDVAAAHAASLAEAMQASAAMGEATAQAVDHALTLLRTRLSETGIELTAQEDHITRSTQSAERLLELVQSAGHHSRSELPDVLRASEPGSTGSTSASAPARGAREAGLRSQGVADAMRATSGEVAETLAGFARLHQAFAGQADEHKLRLDELRATSKPRAARPRRFRATSPERSPARSTVFTPQRKPQGRP
jgi:hypothetical protein